MAGAAPERYERARATARRARQVSPLAELLLVRDSAAAAVVYDPMSGDDTAPLSELAEELREQLRERAGLPVDAAAVPRREGLGLIDLGVTRDAHVLTAGLRSLVGTDVLSAPTWEALARPGELRGRFFQVLRSAADRAGYVIDTEVRQRVRAALW